MSPEPCPVNGHHAYRAGDCLACDRASTTRGRTMSETPKRRLRACVEQWPDAETGEYNPACCRFPKSCSATIYSAEHVTEADLEPMTPAEHDGPVGEVPPEGLREAVRVGHLDLHAARTAEGRVMSENRDRTVHGKTTQGHAIVRYDRSGKWYIEAPSGSGIQRRLVSVQGAAAEARRGTHHSGLPGGRIFDAIVRRVT